MGLTQTLVRLGLYLILAALLARVAVVMTIHPHQREWFSPAFWSQFWKIGEVMRIARVQHVDAERSQYKYMAEPALRAMLRELDPNSSYMNHEDFSRFETHADQNYVGIGVEIERLNQRVTVMEVFDDSPAADAGLLPGDQIIAIGDEETVDFSLTQMVEKLRGPAGTRTRLSVYRPLSGDTLTFDVERRRVDFPSIRDVQMLADGMAYMRISNFGMRTVDEFRQAIDRLEVQYPVRGLIIDLRYNPGGILHAAVGFAGLFLPEGSPVVRVQGRDKSILREEISTLPPRAFNYPVAILINGGSASASEVLAGALQDAGKALIIGEKSVGKASVQSVYSLRPGDGFRLTTAEYFLPSGRTINRTGLTPDFEIPLDDDERLKLLTQRAHRLMAPEAFSERFGFPRERDRQLETAREILTGVAAYSRH